jgi:aminoglycoside phosphotransferase (APT) family kinase protein
MHAGEVDTDPRLVKRLLDQLPQWADLRIEAGPSTGTVNALYRIGDDLVVRLPRVSGWEDDLGKEVRWLPVLAPRLPLAVPVPVARGVPRHGYPFHWAVYRWLPGEDLSAASGVDLLQVAEALVGFVRALRRVPTDEAPRSRRDRPLAARDAELRAAVVAAAGAMDGPAVLRAWEPSVEAAPWSARAVWTHGDLLTPNLLCQDGRLCGVVDFGNMGVGDPAVDLIPAWSVLSEDSRQLFRSGLKHDAGTWLRARGMALHQAVMIIPYYAKTNPGFVATAQKTVHEVAADHALTC